MLLLPDREVADADDLRAILAHELAHARNRDLAWNLAAHVASILLWFHPLAWRLRSVHASACDAVSDAVAADLLGDVVSYGRTLARLAMSAAAMAPTPVLAMARTSDVWRRLEALNRRVFGEPLSRRRAWPACGLGLALVLLVGGVGPGRAGQQGPRRQDPAPAARRSDPAAPAPAARPEFQLRGRVVDASGRPVKGATVRLAENGLAASRPSGDTGAAGEFVIDHCPEGSTVVTVQADGLAPQLREVNIGEGTAPLDFRLEAGSIIRVRILDRARKPVEGAFVFAQGWRAYHSLDLVGKTDAGGRFVWRGAPADAVTYDFGKKGYMAQRQVALIASDREYIVVLHPSLVISGRVTDAETGKPLPECAAVEGFGTHVRGEIYWSRRSSTRVSGGEYSVTFDEPNGVLYVRVEAVGYEPGISRGFRPEEGPQRIDFALRRAEVLGGLIIGPDGKPAGGVEVALVEPDDQVVITGGRFTVQMTAPIVRTGADGRFAFNQP
ncbi:MAG TPA: M56 family metallopeptidase, partial [Isosphaeraceae bacterium]|nr:M56 family metallopeptidase [Isosphaeraceae bacterium]